MADRSSSEQVMALNLLLTILVSENAYTSVKTLVEIWVARLYGKNQFDSYFGDSVVTRYLNYFIC